MYFSLFYFNDVTRSWNFYISQSAKNNLTVRHVEKGMLKILTKPQFCVDVISEIVVLSFSMFISISLGPKCRTNIVGTFLLTKNS